MSRWLLPLLLALGSCTSQHDAPPPILQLADHHDIPPEELGRVTEPSPAPSSAPASPTMPCPPSAIPPRAPLATHRIFSGPPITNHIPPEVIMRPIRTRAGCLRACYQAALSRDPTLHGRVVVHYVVDPDGWVRAARPGDGTDLPPALAQCVAAQFVGLVYPSPDAPVEVHYPLTFEP